MFFTEMIVKTLFLGAFLSLAGNDHTSETSEYAIATPAVKNTIILDDLINGVEETFSSLKSTATGSFEQNCDRFTNETSQQCFLMPKDDPLVVLCNISQNRTVAKNINQTLKWKNGRQLGEWKKCFVNDSCISVKVSLAKITGK